MKPSISILTPTWNRANYLNKVWSGLVEQSYKNFEWIVANDGSEDDTVEVVKGLAAKSNFPVTLINADRRVGKSRMDNELVKRAQGEFILWCDSDDVLLPNALEVLLETWNSIPTEQRGEFCGVSALCDTESGVLGNKFYHSEETIDLKWNELFQKLNADLVIFTRTDLVKAHPFLEVDFLIPESSVWSMIGNRKTRFLPVVLERKEYKVVNCLSYSGHMSYNRGNAYAMAIIKDFITHQLSLKEKLFRLINYIRYAVHGDIDPITMIRLWKGGILSSVSFALAAPVALSLVVKDRLQDKVRKTHKDFEIAIKKVKVEIFQLN